jgi:catechol 2,3-dioxygenase-like lactoylglutathione lyase family enzyme
MAKFVYDHIHFVSADPVKTGDFFIKNFGATKVREIVTTSGIYVGTSVELIMQGSKLIFHPPRATQSKGDVPRERHGLEHFGMCTDDIHGAVASLKAQGCKVLEEPYVGISGNTIAFVEGPDNILIELKQAVL